MIASARLAGARLAVAMLAIAALAAAGSIPATAASVSSDARPAADLIVRNARIWTVNPVQFTTPRQLSDQGR